MNVGVVRCLFIVGLCLALLTTATFYFSIDKGRRSLREFHDGWGNS